MILFSVLFAYSQIINNFLKRIQIKFFNNQNKWACSIKSYDSMVGRSEHSVEVMLHVYALVIGSNPGGSKKFFFFSLL